MPSILIVNSVRKNSKLTNILRELERRSVDVMRGSSYGEAMNIIYTQTIAAVLIDGRVQSANNIPGILRSNPSHRNTSIYYFARDAQELFTMEPLADKVYLVEKYKLNEVMADLESVLGSL